MSTRRARPSTIAGWLLGTCLALHGAGALAEQPEPGEGAEPAEERGRTLTPEAQALVERATQWVREARIPSRTPVPDIASLQARLRQARARIDSYAASAAAVESAGGALDSQLRELGQAAQAQAETALLLAETYRGGPAHLYQHAQRILMLCPETLPAQSARWAAIADAASALASQPPGAASGSADALPHAPASSIDSANALKDAMRQAAEGLAARLGAIDDCNRFSPAGTACAPETLRRLFEDGAAQLARMHELAAATRPQQQAARKDRDGAEAGYEAAASSLAAARDAAYAQWTQLGADARDIAGRVDAATSACTGFERSDAVAEAAARVAGKLYDRLAASGRKQGERRLLAVRLTAAWEMAGASKREALEQSQRFAAELAQAAERSASVTRTLVEARSQARSAQSLAEPASAALADLQRAEANLAVWDAAFAEVDETLWRAGVDLNYAAMRLASLGGVRLGPKKNGGQQAKPAPPPKPQPGEQPATSAWAETIHVWAPFAQPGEEARTQRRVYTYVLFPLNPDCPVGSHDPLCLKYRATLERITQLGRASAVSPELVMRTNVFFIPTRRALEAQERAGLEQYGFDLATTYLGYASGLIVRSNPRFQERLAADSGPFLVSTLKPLNEIWRMPKADVLYVDLSRVPPAGVRQVVRDYMQQINHEGVVGQRELAGLKQRALNIILRTAAAVEDVLGIGSAFAGQPP
jgi:hypothetical protein